MTEDLVWQFDLAWALAELHLSELEPDPMPIRQSAGSPGT